MWSVESLHEEDSDLDILDTFESKEEADEFAQDIDVRQYGVIWVKPADRCI
jgi:predicted CoA-binding protein